MSLLQDMLPDPKWAKRGGTDRDGSTLTVRRARVLASSMGITKSILQFFLILALVWGLQNRTPLAFLFIAIPIAVSSLDWSRGTALMEVTNSLLVASRIRIGFAIAFLAPILLYVLLKFLGSLDPVTFSLLAGDRFAKQLSTFVFIALTLGLPILNNWLNRSAALASTDPDMDKIFVPKQALSTKKAVVS